MHAAARGLSIGERVEPGALVDDDRAHERFVREHAGEALRFAKRYLTRDKDASEAVIIAFRRAAESPILLVQTDSSSVLQGFVLEAVAGRLSNRFEADNERIQELLPCFLENGDFAEESSIRHGALNGLSRNAVRSAIKGLPDSFRFVFVLHDVDGPKRSCCCFDSRSE